MAIFDPGATAAWASAYSDRVRPPAETVAAMKPHFADLGITRLARQTGLDRLGIPCFAALRPNSRTLASHQGKGLDDAAAMASAVMEAAEYAIAERPQTTRRVASRAELEQDAALYFDASRQLPMGASLAPDLPISWLEGQDLIDGSMVWVPEALVRLDDRPPQIPGLCRSTNGLASGNTRAEAIFHGLCELVERDATTLWSLLTIEQQAARAIDIAAFADAAVAYLAEQVAAAGFTLALFDLSSDTALPTVMAMIGGGETDEDRFFGITSGYGTHPVAARAAIRAITEAAQSRVTMIAGSRDDIASGDFRRTAEADHQILLHAQPSLPAPNGLPAGTKLPALIEAMAEALAAVGADAIAVDVGGDPFGIAVVKIVSTVLEDREPNSNWRPGARSIAILMGQP